MDRRMILALAVAAPVSTFPFPAAASGLSPVVRDFLKEMIEADYAGIGFFPWAEENTSKIEAARELTRYGIFKEYMDNMGEGDYPVFWLLPKGRDFRNNFSK